MRRNLLPAAALLLLCLPTQSLLAQSSSERKTWKRTGAWEVGFYRSIGCAIDNVDIGAPATTMDWKDGKLVLMALHKDWFGLDLGTEGSHEMIFRFTPESVHRTRAIFRRFEAKQVGALAWAGLGQEFLDDFARKTRLRVEHQGRVLADYDLRGAGEALIERDACHKAGGKVVIAPAAPSPAPAPVLTRPPPARAAPLPSETNPLR